MRDHNDDRDARDEALKATTDPNRKPYHSPRLVVYGDLPHLTMPAKRGSRNDGGGEPKTKM
jgi:hypothetical protein